jgi:hypothetical protein
MRKCSLDPVFFLRFHFHISWTSRVRSYTYVRIDIRPKATRSRDMKPYEQNRIERADVDTDLNFARIVKATRTNKTGPRNGSRDRFRFPIWILPWIADIVIVASFQFHCFWLYKITRVVGSGFILDRLKENSKQCSKSGEIACIHQKNRPEVWCVRRHHLVSIHRGTIENRKCVILWVA